MEIPKPQFTPKNAEKGTNAYWDYHKASNDIVRLTAAFVGNAIAGKQLKTDSKEDFFNDLDEMINQHQGLNSNKRILTEMLLSRITDNLLTYLSDLLRIILQEKPAVILSEKGTLDIKRIFDANNLEELKKEIIEERVLQLSYKSVSELAKYLNGKLGFNIFSNKIEESIVTKTIEARNIIVHNRCRINFRYNQRTGFPNSPVGKILNISFSDVIRMNGYFDELALRIDERAVSKFSLDSVPNNLIQPTPKSGATD